MNQPATLSVHAVKAAYLKNLCMALTGAGVILLSNNMTCAATKLDADAINDAQYTSGRLPEGQSALTVKLQVLLDRAHFSPGVIDGYQGGNTALAIKSLERENGLEVDGRVDEDVWKILTSDNRSGEQVSKPYTITQDDTKKISSVLPSDYSRLAELDWLGYTSVAEKIAERFHMDIELLRTMNPGVDWSANSDIQVVTPLQSVEGTVHEIVVDKGRQQVIAKNEQGKTLATFPATIGSNETPSPEGSHEVVAIATEPVYSYKPDENFTQGDNDQALTLPPGPNGPVGLVWIDLSKPTYGLHGTAEPATIGKTASHGCVRLTNWDALHLAKITSPGTTVRFVK